MRELYYRPVKMECEDGRTRTVYVRSCYDGRHWVWHGDTAFSVPAYTRAKGKTVRGYVGSFDDAPRFVATLYHRNHACIAKLA